MRSFLRNLSLFSISHLCIWAIIFAVYLTQRPFSLEFGAVINDKEQLLERQASPRIILVGGSNLLFGINSPEIERRTGYHPINMGLNIGDGLAFMLNNVSRWPRPGDIIIISPEYEHFGDFYYGRGEFLYAEVEQRPAVIRSFTPGNFLEVLNKGFIIGGNIVRYTVQGKGKAMRSYIDGEMAVYKRAAVNQYGDVTGHYHVPYRLQAKDIIVGPANSHVTPQSIARAIESLNRFSIECERRGARLFYSFPPVPEAIFQKHGAVIESIAASLRERLRFPLLDTPEEMAFPMEDFFDAYYHLTFEGGLRRTDKLIESLNQRGILMERNRIAP